MVTNKLTMVTSTPVQAHANVEKTINQSNELLEVNHGSKAMDRGITQTTSGKDQAVATVGKINGSYDYRG